MGCLPKIVGPKITKRMSTNQPYLGESCNWKKWKKVQCICYVSLLTDRQIDQFYFVKFQFLADKDTKTCIVQNFYVVTSECHGWVVWRAAGATSPWTCSRFEAYSSGGAICWLSPAPCPTFYPSIILLYNWTISQNNHKQPKPRQGDATDHGDFEGLLDEPEHAGYFNRGGELEILQLEPPCKRLAVGCPPIPTVSHSDHQVPWPRCQMWVCLLPCWVLPCEIPNVGLINVFKK